ncbi:hypothetical protein EVAR_44154_1 [Eumeta japonica]|uniref:Uncharacterized protein n=1 Tax=Eumeta variegata TaxID=151549 RepID=A0A4C1XJW7_EUMVA|nr:hypothetical protein EVAR_44154_1 [Eumeta japonica]
MYCLYEDLIQTLTRFHSKRERIVERRGLASKGGRRAPAAPRPAPARAPPRARLIDKFLARRHAPLSACTASLPLSKAFRYQI